MAKAQWGTFIIRINESGDGSEIGDSTKESTRNSNDGMDSKDITCLVKNTKQQEGDGPIDQRATGAVKI